MGPFQNPWFQSALGRQVAPTCFETRGSGASIGRWILRVGKNHQHMRLFFPKKQATNQRQEMAGRMTCTWLSNP